jgi:hypothetical protein
MVTKKVFFYGLLAANSFVSFIPCHSQDTANTIGNVSIASPNAASLGKYGDIPVSYNTGTPQISIPIYRVESGSLRLSISLSYDASGLKAAEIASWVGAGWSLNAGGMITRSVLGAPDDRGFSISNVWNGHYSDYGFNSYLNNAAGQIDDGAFFRGNKDGEPDLYFFNFAGYTGKFYFNDDRTPILVPEQDLKIQPFLESAAGFVGFIVTAPDGVKYYFGKTGNNGLVHPIESTIPATLQNGITNANAAAASWFLNKIISADGTDSITLSYQAENYSYYTLTTPPVLHTNYLPSRGDKMGIDLVKNFVSGVRLTQVNFANGTIIFTKAASVRTDIAGGSSVDNSFNDAANSGASAAYALGSISITDNNGFCKKDSFYYAYFFDNSALNSTFFPAYSIYNLHSDQYRLRLDSVQEIACNGSTKIPPYKFSYFTETVPRRLSFGFDHWGYPNGIPNNPGLVPTFTVITGGTSITTNGANRDAAWPAMRAGSLQQLSYPTGGFTSFDFEPKSIDTFNSSVFQNVFLTSLVVHEFGQSNILQTQPFTLSAMGGDCSINVNNTSTNWSPSLIIQNSNGAEVYSSGLIPISSVLSTSIALPAGNYTATLSFPANSQSTLTGGADGTIGQWQWVPVQTTMKVGGLRVKTITTNDGATTSNIVTSFTYPGAAGSNGGILYSIPVYLQVIRNDLMALVWPLSCSPNGCQSCDGLNAHNYFISAGSIRPMATMQGEHVGYNEVYVSQTGNGKTVYRYYGSSIWNNNLTDVCVRTLTQSGTCSLSIPNFPAPPLPFEFMRGELQYEGYFNEAGQVLKEVTHYPVYVADSLATPGHISINQPGLSSYTEYQLRSAYKIQDKAITISYDPVHSNSTTTTTTTYYGSLYHHQPTRTVATTSTSDSLATKAKYAFDFRVIACDIYPDSLAYYNAAVHNDTTWLNSNIANCTPQNNQVSNCRSSIFAQFRQMMSQARVNFIRYRKRKFTDSASLVNSCYLAASQSGDAILKPVLRLRNASCNPEIETNEWRNNNLLHSSLIRYDTSTSPLGFAYPGKTKLINLTSPSASFSIATVSGNTITTDSRYKDESSYVYDDGNPLQVTPHNGIVTSYLWDYQNSEPIAKISGAANNQVAYSSFEADGKGNWNFNGTPGTDNTAPTGRKIYTLNGSNGVTKSGLTSGTTYIVSYWTKNPSAYSIAGTLPGYPISGRTVDGWKYFEHRINGQTSTSISGTGTIDELRLYPANSQMATYTYDPLKGVTAQCDLNNRVNYYQYDSLGRLTLIKDLDKNIVKRVSYVYTDKVVIPGVALTSTNSAGAKLFTARYTNISTGIQYNFSIPLGAGQSLGSLPAGNYNLIISKTGNTMSYGFYVGTSFYVFDTSASFSNVGVNAATNNYILIQNN